MCTASASLLEILCADELVEWGVTVVQLNAMQVMVQYRDGVEEIVTGIRFPRASQNPYDVLDVPVNSTALPLRKAYHKMSLKWHPDRWVGYPGMHTRN
jgi:hypothetical protein